MKGLLYTPVNIQGIQKSTCFIIGIEHGAERAQHTAFEAVWFAHLIAPFHLSNVDGTYVYVVCRRHKENKKGLSTQSDTGWH